MTRAEREATVRIADLENALRAIGRLLTEKSEPPARRIERAMGILIMYDCQPKESGCV